ncbi:hypothetical protein BJ165DRAFT_1476798 [Panaeolus papilionaceus]|nr:hypothetical protein BJ165DRAFT_1476798 [Panaeolus papilionaceus]
MNNLATQMDINDPQLSVPPPIVKRTHTPSWLANAMETYRVKYPYDRFEVILRTIKRSSPPEWRLRCSDCPGKVAIFYLIVVSMLTSTLVV